MKSIYSFTKLEARMAVRVAVNPQLGFGGSLRSFVNFGPYSIPDGLKLNCPLGSFTVVYI